MDSLFCLAAASYSAGLVFNSSALCLKGKIVISVWFYLFYRGEIIMDMSKISSPMPVAPRQLNQVQATIPGRPPVPMPSTSSSEPFLEYKVRVPRHLAKNYYMMRFQSGKPDLSSITKATMSREGVSSVDKEEEILPKSGAGSEYGRERREEARKRRRGYIKKAADPDSVPWNLKLGGKGGKRYSGKKEAGINDNSSYYILTQCPDGAFEAVPVTSWYNFTPNINYRTLTADEAEEEFVRRDKTVNFFSLMVKKRLQNNEDAEDKEKEKGPSTSRSMKLFDDDDDRNSSDDDDFNDDDDEKPKQKQDKSSKVKKGKTKGKSKAKKGSGDESNASSEEDGYFDSKEVDYMSDTSSSSEEERKEEPVKPDTKDDLNAESSDSDSEEDDELTNAGKDIKKILQKGQGERGSSDEEDEDPDNDEDVKGSAAVLLQDKAKSKKKVGSRSSTSSSSRSSTPTKGAENPSVTSTVQAAAKKLEGRPGTPTGKGKKRPASDPVKGGFKSISDSQSSKKARVSPGPSSQSGSASNTPTPGDNGNTITEDSVRRYLARKPMTTKDLLQKFKSKKTGLTNEQTVQLIATILKKIQPEQNKIKGKLYLSLKSTSTS